MATKLFKLAIDATTTTDVDVTPTVEKYFYDFVATDRVGDTITIPATSFTNDAGTAVTTLTTAVTDNGYYLLFINGVLQQTSLYTVTSANVVITDATTVPVDAPITLVVTNFVPEADSTTTITT